MKVGVVGGGVIGLAVGYYLSESGADVTLVERGAFGGGCSLGNGGWICPSISTPLPAPGLTSSLLSMLRSESPLYIRPSAIPELAGWLWAFRRHCTRVAYERGVEALARLNAETPALYRALAADGVEFEFGEAGTLLAFSTHAKLDAVAMELRTLEPHGVGPMQALDATGLAGLEPALEGDLIGGLLVESDLHVRPETLTAGLAAALEARGAELIAGNEVSEFIAEGGRVRALDTPGGPVDVDAVVLATGAEAAALVHGLGVRLPVQAGKGYSITVQDPKTTLGRPVYLADAKMGFTPFDGALRTLGTMELSGINLRLDRRRIEILERGARRYLPGGLEGSSRTDWVGMRPITPDGLPVLGQLPTTDNAFVATGHQMLGVTLGPSTGRALAQLILEGRSDVDLGAFAPSRF